MMRFKQTIYRLTNPVFLSILLISGCQKAGGPDFRLDLGATDLPTFLDFTSERLPLVSAHRGGRGLAGFPENALETFQQVAPQTPGLIECDVNMTKDSILILLHDDDLDRTTTGKGPVLQKTWQDLQTLRLVDDFGKRTRFQIPLFEAILDWSSGACLLAVDVKQEVPFERVVQVIQRKNAQSFATVIAYTLEDAQLINRLDPYLMISVTIESIKDLQTYLEAGLPANRLMAFTGLGDPNPNLYEALHAYGIPVTLATFSTVDDQPKHQRKKSYADLLKTGVDIIATDRPLEVGALVLERWENQDFEKKQFYKAIQASAH